MVHVQSDGFQIGRLAGAAAGRGTELNIDGDVNITVGAEPVRVTNRRRCWCTYIPGPAAAGGAHGMRE